MFRIQPFVCGKNKNYFQPKALKKEPRQQRLVAPSLHVQRNFGNQVMAQIDANGQFQLENSQPEQKTDGVFNSTLQSSLSSGEPIAEPTRTFMEASFGTSLDRVRVHTDRRAEVMSKSLGAEAFTYGRNIYFNSGRYSPQTANGAKLLAHELVHTAQQGFQDSQIPDYIPVSTPEEPMEYQADSISTRIIENISGNQGNISKNVEGIKTQRIQPKIQMAKNVDVGIYETMDQRGGIGDAPEETFKVKANSIKEAGNNLGLLMKGINSFSAGSEVKQLSFYGHAAPGNQSVGAGKGSDSAKEITMASINMYPDDFKTIYNPLANGANIILRGCNAGAGKTGLALLKEIKGSAKKLSGKDVTAHGWTGSSYHKDFLWIDWWTQTGQRVSSEDKVEKKTWEEIKKKGK